MEGKHALHDFVNSSKIIPKNEHNLSHIHLRPNYFRRVKGE